MSGKSFQIQLLSLLPEFLEASWPHAFYLFVNVEAHGARKAGVVKEKV